MTSAGVICEIMNDDGTMARVPQLVEFCRTHNLKMLTVAELIRYRMQHERYVHRVAETPLPPLRRFPDGRLFKRSGSRTAHRARPRGTWRELIHEARRRSCAFTRIASQAMSSPPPAATAAKLSRARCRRLSLKIAACSSICTTQDAVSELIQPAAAGRSCREFDITRVGRWIATWRASAWCSTKAESARKS